MVQFLELSVRALQQLDNCRRKKKIPIFLCQKEYGLKLKSTWFKSQLLSLLCDLGQNIHLSEPQFLIHKNVDHPYTFVN